jgi:hypothetical protein
VTTMTHTSLCSVSSRQSRQGCMQCLQGGPPFLHVEQPLTWRFHQLSALHCSVLAHGTHTLLYKNYADAWNTTTHIISTFCSEEKWWKLKWRK